MEGTVQLKHRMQLMDSSFGFVDIIFLAMVAGFLILRLRATLGQRTGEDRGRDLRGTRLESARDDRAQAPGLSDPSSPAPLGSMAVDDEVAAGLAQIAIADPSFEDSAFLSGANEAFEIIVNAYAAGDRDRLRLLLTDSVYNGFEQVIASRESAGQTMETNIDQLHETSIIGARIEDVTVAITVRFTSDQVTTIKDSEGCIVEGGPSAVEHVTDEWTFIRDTSRSDPNWLLSATHDAVRPSPPSNS